MKKKVIDQIKLIAYISGICISIIGGTGAVIKPHAKLFIKKVHAEQERGLCARVDSLIAIIERNDSALKTNVDKIYFIVMESIPRAKRVAALKKFKEYYAKEIE